MQRIVKVVTDATLNAYHLVAKTVLTMNVQGYPFLFASTRAINFRAK
jgi:hypothetical protein